MKAVEIDLSDVMKDFPVTFKLKSSKSLLWRFKIFSLAIDGLRKLLRLPMKVEFIEEEES